MLADRLALLELLTLLFGVFAIAYAIRARSMELSKGASLISTFTAYAFALAAWTITILGERMLK